MKYKSLTLAIFFTSHPNVLRRVLFLTISKVHFVQNIVPDLSLKLFQLEQRSRKDDL